MLTGTNRQADEVAAQQRHWRHVPAVVTPTPVTTTAATAADAGASAADANATDATTAASDAATAVHSTDTRGPPPAVKAAHAVIKQVRTKAVPKAVAQPLSLFSVEQSLHCELSSTLLLMLCCCCC
jgi:hypothetical protein